jgi:ABC-three component (ABC-3C) system Middle Component 8
VSLDHRIDDVALLATLVLVFLPLFTSARISSLASLSVDANATKKDGRRELCLNGSLVVITALVFPPESLFLPALNFLFILGLVEYRALVDSFEYLGE